MNDLFTRPEAIEDSTVYTHNACLAKREQRRKNI